MLALQPSSRSFSLFLFNVTATPETYTLSLHDALPIFTPYESWRHEHAVHHATAGDLDRRAVGDLPTLTVAEYRARSWRSEEHTSELQSRQYLVCRLLLEKNKTINAYTAYVSHYLPEAG